MRWVAVQMRSWSDVTPLAPHRRVGHRLRVPAGGMNPRIGYPVCDCIGWQRKGVWP